MNLLGKGRRVQYIRPRDRREDEERRGNDGKKAQKGQAKASASLKT